MSFEFDLPLFLHYLWPPSALESPVIRAGLAATIALTLVAESIGLALGLFLGLGRMSRHRVYRWPATAYVNYFRGTPLLVQLSLIYFGSAALGLYHFPDVYLGNFVIAGSLQAGALGLGLNQGAYTAEVVRAGILAIDSGQMEAAKSLGMTFAQGMRKVVLPQAARVMVPPLGNDFNGLMKGTTLVVLIGTVELFNSFQLINSIYFRPFELYLALSVYYLQMTLLWGVVQQWLERRLSISLREETVVAEVGATRP